MASDNNCLFVANLPQRLTNEQLALAILNAFRPFGPVLTVKASRDSRGRPFGFVEFADARSAEDAMAAAPFIHINFRQVRIELAKCQKKISVKCKDMDIERFKQRLLEHAGQEQDGSSGTGAGNLKISISGDCLMGILKFTDKSAAEKAFNDLGSIEGFSVEWLEAVDRHGHGIRNSGLVQVVPSKLPCFIHASPVYPSWVEPSPIIFPSRPVPEPIFEEEIIAGGAMPAGEEDEFDLISVNSEGKEKAIPERILEATIFAGRLNSQKISKDLLLEHFKVHGTIRYICLFNRGARTAEGIPLDAYAFITYAGQANAAEAIKQENGTVWLGQTIKCEPARVLPPTPVVVQLYHRQF